MNNERLKILIDALVKLAEYWTRTQPGSTGHHSIHMQIDFIRKLIREELKK
jgi:hypothetical protein